MRKPKRKNEKIISGEIAFELHGTYGFPFDLTREIAEENGLAVDEEGFKLKMKEHQILAREDYRSKHGSAWGDDIYSKLDVGVKTEFIGYGEEKANAKVLYLIKDDQVVDSASKGEKVTVILDRTPFMPKAEDR